MRSILTMSIVALGFGFCLAQTQEVQNQTQDEFPQTAQDTAPAPAGQKLEKSAVEKPAKARQSLKETEVPARYVVVKGDTLWDISELFFSDGFKWKEIHEINKDLVKNPDLIYPQQALSLSLVAVPEKPQAVEPVKEPEAAVLVEKTAEIAVQEPEPDEEMPELEVAAATPAPTEETIAEESDMPAVGQESAGEPVVEFTDYDGKVVSSHDIKRIFYSQGDKVYINLGANDGLIEGDILKIVRKKKKVYDPRVQKKIWIIEDLGRLKVTPEIYETRSECEIIYSHDPVNIGDGVVRLPRGRSEAIQ